VSPSCVGGWFEITGPSEISIPPAFNSADEIRIGDLFVYISPSMIQFWLWKLSCLSPIANWAPITEDGLGCGAMEGHVLQYERGVSLWKFIEG
jgi:hypothetical protein